LSTVPETLDISIFADLASGFVLAGFVAVSAAKLKEATSKQAKTNIEILLIILNDPPSSYLFDALRSEPFRAFNSAVLRSH
jgi:hypothetical protein